MRDEDESTKPPEVAQAEREVAQPREVARAALIAALFDLRARPAEAAFEALLANTGITRALDPLALRELRWWHKASQAELRRHAEELLPAIWGLLESADRRRQTDFEQDRASWSLAANLADSAGPPASPGDSDLHFGVADGLKPTGAIQDSSPENQDRFPEPSPATSAEAEPVGTVRPNGPGAATLDSARRRRALYELRRYEPRPDVNPILDSTTPNGAPTPRRLVVGLTVLPGAER